MINFSEELFTIVKVKLTRPHTYIISDDHGEDLVGSFYEPELQKVADKSAYRIEKFIERRWDSKKKAYFVKVKWYGYPSSFDSWLPEKSVGLYKN